MFTVVGGCIFNSLAPILKRETLRYLGMDIAMPRNKRVKHISMCTDFVIIFVHNNEWFISSNFHQPEP